MYSNIFLSPLQWIRKLWPLFLLGDLSVVLRVLIIKFNLDPDFGLGFCVTVLLYKATP